MLQTLRGIDVNVASHASIEVRQFTVSESVEECCTEPEVAITVTTDVTGGGCESDEDPPAQPLSRPSPTSSAATCRCRCSRLRFLQLNMQNAMARVLPGSQWLYRQCKAAVVAEAVTVSVVAAVPPDGMTVAGEKLQDASAGRPEQLKETGEVNPFSDVIETVTEPLSPAVRLREGKELATEKSGAGRLMV